MTTPDDPMRGSDLPPVPPGTPAAALHVPPVAIGPVYPDTTAKTAARHAIDLNAVPLPGDEPLTVATVSEHVVDVDERQSLIKKRVDRTQGAVFVACLLGLAALAIGIYLFFAVHALGQRIDDQGAVLTADRTERARVDNLHRNSICELAVALRGTASTPTRNAWVQGGAAYDRFYAAISTSAQDLQCDAR